MVVSLISQVDYEYRDNNYSNEENDSESIIVSYHTSRKTILLNHLKKENFEKGQEYLQIILLLPWHVNYLFERDDNFQLWLKWSNPFNKCTFYTR